MVHESVFGELEFPFAGAERYADAMSNEHTLHMLITTENNRFGPDQDNWAATFRVAPTAVSALKHLVRELPEGEIGIEDCAPKSPGAVVLAMFSPTHARRLALRATEVGAVYVPRNERTAALVEAQR